MCHVLPTTLLCAALDHSFHSFSLSLCPNHNKVYIHISNQTWYALLSAFFGSYCWNICMTFTLPNAYHSVWVVFQVACLLSPVFCLYGNIYLSVSVYIVNVILYFKYKFGLYLESQPLPTNDPSPSSSREGQRVLGQTVGLAQESRPARRQVQPGSLGCRGCSPLVAIRQMLPLPSEAQSPWCWF